MDDVRIRARFDGLVELGGAAALGLAAGFAGLRLAPSLQLAPAAAMTASAAACFGLGMLAMRAVKPDQRAHALAEFHVEPMANDDDVLLLDVIHDEPLLLTDVVEDDAMLLDDPLSGLDPDSRVVQLFASPRVPTPGQLKDRIDRHLATGTMHVVHEFEGPAPDAADALYAALADLRRSLR